MDKDMKTTAEAAADLEREAKNEPDTGIYVHTFRHPFDYRAHTYETLTFDWETLTGEDYLAIENEMLRKGKTLVTPAFSGDFLCGMAVRACTARNDEGFRAISTEALKAMPMRDFQAICGRARNFLLRAE